MTDENNIITEEEHKKLGISLFNATWGMMDKTDRTPQEDEEMLNMAYSSAYHWSKIGNPVNLQRSQWQISRVYSILERGEPAMYHAKRCMYYTELMLEKQLNDEGFADFDLAFAYEALTRASTLVDDKETFDNYYAYASTAGSKIKKKEDKDWFEQQLSTIQYPE